MTQNEKKGKGLSSFSPMFWLVVLFEFFERGSYYGMMSILSVYLTQELHFAKESVGLIKGTIQPLLYFLPIISGALADRFGYRRTLMIAFSLLGLGYFLTAQATSYALVFGALVVMGIGAGTFKPIISGTIARVTNEENSTLGFGIFYWSINLGAFLFPLILVPFLKKMDWTYVIIASAVGTAAMLLPTIFFFKEPVRTEKNDKKKQTNLVQTLANAFEIIYSPIVLLYNAMKNTLSKRVLIGVILLAMLGYSLFSYLKPPVTSELFPTIGIVKGQSTVHFTVDRNMLSQEDFNVEQISETPNVLDVTVFKPQNIDQFGDQLITKLNIHPGFENLTAADLQEFISMSDKKVEITFQRSSDTDKSFQIEQPESNKFLVSLNDFEGFSGYKNELHQNLADISVLSPITLHQLDNLYEKSKGRSFFYLYVILIILVGLIISAISSGRRNGDDGTVQAGKNNMLPFILVSALGMVFWFLPGLTMLGRIISFVIYFTTTSLFIIDKSDSAKFVDHAKFLLMIFLYSGFWILYFQMFDSVLWYVQAYVDASTLNASMNSFLGFFGIDINWFFDVEHVTVINAGTIILLQLVISNIVKNTKALPTMIVGIGIATIGMAILAISTSIWIFLVGIVLFSVGEMTAHPKFISYIGLIAPSDKKAMYMGYLFLYGVFGSSIGGILGAKLYVHFVDNLNQPTVLWMVFSMIGVATIVALLLYNKFLAAKPSKSA